MRISNISGNNISFKKINTTGWDANYYDRILKPHSDELNSITKDCDVVIERGSSVELHDEYHDQMIPTYPTVVTIEPSRNAAYRTIPMIKLYVNPEANPCLGGEYEAEDIIDTIKKGISII